MGLTDEMVEGFWRWTSSGRVANFTNWHPGQPDNSGSVKTVPSFMGVGKTSGMITLALLNLHRYAKRGIVLKGFLHLNICDTLTSE